MSDKTPAECDANEDAVSITPDEPSGRLRGSAPYRSRAVGEPAAGGAVAPLDLPGVSVPDVAFQFKPCLPSLESNIKDAIRDAVPAAADVRVGCFHNTDRIGIWIRPVGGADDDAARNAGLQSLDLLRSGENYAAFINATLIRGQAADAFADQPKRLDGDGRPDPHGPVHLTGLRLDFRAPHIVLTTVDGFDERPWPDVDFHLITSDTLFASAGQVQSHSDHHLDTDTSVFLILEGIAAILTVFVSGWFVLPALLFFGEGVIIAGKGPPDTGAGAGASAVGALPSEIMIPSKLKVVMNYERVEVSAGGIFAGGFIVLDVRTPAVAITGPRQLAVKEGSTVARHSYALTTEDLRGPLSFTWTSDGITGNPHLKSTVVTFPLHNPTAGQIFSKNVHVQVTDVDGLIAEATATIQIHIVAADLDDGLPPICHVKPWLPQCQP
jgi:hypothetical protein